MHAARKLWADARTPKQPFAPTPGCCTCRYPLCASVGGACAMVQGTPFSYSGFASARCHAEVTASVVAATPPAVGRIEPTRNGHACCTKH